ncbi:CAP domain-containing protein [Pontibacillus sp. ALD_SL1]|uniref:CAP domain-containing protein n=1 Tax=Pontibacillus sp. ALD_SL1 TaxID=2777185 RepID=UPI001A957FDF|nr:CAP domain-containing protein [Pontibacillus sp. ALD_SL1]QSS99798.1 CAP domain-containing protein [Pontibacillus sp. ALD_SL1]
MKIMKYGVSMFTFIVFFLLVSSNSSASTNFIWVKPVTEVNPYKNWTIQFNTEMDRSTFNNIRVKDSTEDEVDVVVSVSNDDKRAIVEAPNGGYIGGETYTLIINKGVASVRNKQLQEEVRMDFTIKIGPEMINTKEEIMAKWNLYKPTFEGNPFSSYPSISFPYELGGIKQGFLEDGLNMTNFMRYLSGLPDDLELDQSLNQQAQYGAVLLAANGLLSHHPPKPSDMSEEFFNIGYRSTSRSNLHVYYRHENYNWAYEVEDEIQMGTLEGSVYSYMMDEDSNNIDSVGHRRWILNPPLKNIAFGFAMNNDIDENFHYTYSTMQVFDKSREDKVEYDFIGWPSSNRYFPNEFFKSDAPWSVSLNPHNYQLPSMDEVEVRLKRLSDGEIWTLDKKDNYFDAKERNVSGEYFNVNSRLMGVRYCIIFRPDPLEVKEYKGLYEVTIEGLKDRNGNDKTLQYTVNFFDMFK